jgi:hypothetical protein
MSKFISITLAVLLAETWQVFLYAFYAARDLATIGLFGPLAGALVGAGVAVMLEQLWSRANPLARNVIFVSITIFFIGLGTTYYQRYAEQITHDARVLHPQAAYTTGAWGDDPWMMYPELANLGFGAGCQHLSADVLESLATTLRLSVDWLPAVILISWITTWPPSAPREPEVRGAVPA